MHFETDGGTGHIATLFSNQIVYLGLFLIGNMDTLMETHGCPGILYLNTCKREILLLNIGLSSLVLSLGVGEDEWLMTEVILGAISMKDVRAAISAYDLELPKLIEDLQRQLLGLQKNAPVTNNATALDPLPLAESDKEENDSDVPPLHSENIDNE